MIRLIYGLPEITVSSLSLYTGAILEANLLPPPEPKESWRRIMDELSVISCDLYRGYVRENKDFVPYFRSATGTRIGQTAVGFTSGETSPNRRRRSLRAIPWIFAWTQNRLMLPPGWVQVRRCKKWSKMANRASWKPCAAIGHSSRRVSACWRWSSPKQTCGWRNTVDQRLVDKALWPLGKELRNLQEETSKWCWRLPTIPI